MTKRQDNLRQMAWAEYLKIRSVTTVAQNLGLPTTTVRSWIRDYQQINNELPPTLRYQNEMAWREQTERVRKESTSDIYVNHYGKPPAGRSALDQKQKEQSNDERKANPYHINRYYRQPG